MLEVVPCFHDSSTAAQRRLYKLICGSTARRPKYAVFRSDQFCLFPVDLRFKSGSVRQLEPIIPWTSTISESHWSGSRYVYRSSQRLLRLSDVTQLPRLARIMTVRVSALSDSVSPGRLLSLDLLLFADPAKEVPATRSPLNATLLSPYRFRRADRYIGKSS